MLTAFLLAIEIDEGARWPDPGIVGEQAAIAANQISRLPAPRPMQRGQHAPEKILALHRLDNSFRRP
jgi:hypothetical protein